MARHSAVNRARKHLWVRVPPYQPFFLRFSTISEMKKASWKTHEPLQRCAEILRRDLNYSLEKISITLGVSQSTASAWLKNIPLNESCIADARARKNADYKAKLAIEREHRKASRTAEVSVLFDQLKGTKAKGSVSMLMVAARLALRGYRVMEPVGDHCRYDLAAEKDGLFYRVQVKTARLDKSESPVFPTASSYAHRGGCRKGYGEDVDFIACYCPDIDACFMFPMADVVAKSSKAVTEAQIERCRI